MFCVSGSFKWEMFLKKWSEKRSLPVWFHCTVEELLKDHVKIQLKLVLKKGWSSIRSGFYCTVEQLLKDRLKIQLKLVLKESWSSIPSVGHNTQSQLHCTKPDYLIFKQSQYQDQDIKASIVQWNTCFKTILKSSWNWSGKRAGLPLGFRCTVEHYLKDYLKIQLKLVSFRWVIFLSKHPYPCPTLFTAIKLDTVSPTEM